MALEARLKAEIELLKAQNNKQKEEIEKLSKQVANLQSQLNTIKQKG